jgi:DNA-directed RNA polymerase sigma subunit (sigma70/sigma32)
MADQQRRSGAAGRGGAAKRRSRPEEDDPARVLARPLKKVLDRLPDVERRVIEFRMGLVDGHPHPIGETAKEVGLSLKEAKEIEARAFARIREVVPLEQLQKYLGS